MRPSSLSPVRRLPRAPLALVAAGLLLVGFVVAAPDVLAHHAQIEASADCSGVVEWSARAWSGSSQAEQTNNEVRVWYLAGEGSQPEVDLATGAFNITNAYRFSGQFDWPDPAVTSLTLFVQEQVSWGLDESGAEPGSPRSVTIVQPTGCEPAPDVDPTEPPVDEASPTTSVTTSPPEATAPPPEIGAVESTPGTPSVAAALACAPEGGVVTINLSNTSPPGQADSIVFVVGDPLADPGSPISAVQFVVVPAGESRLVVFERLAEGQHSIPISADGTPLAPVVVVVECQKPQLVGLLQECAEGGVILGLANPGPSPATLVVSKDGTEVEAVTVPAVSTVEVFVPMDEGETAAITVTEGDEVIGSITVTRTCTSPPATPTSVTPPPTISMQSIEPPPAEVLGTVQTRSGPTTTGSLPVMGAESGRLALLAAGLVMCGAGLLLLSRRHPSLHRGTG
jgi:hypothetical protein